MRRVRSLDPILEERRTRGHVAAWRRLYEATAGSSDWEVVHRWGYGEAVTAAVAADVRGKLMLEPGNRVLEVGCASGVFLSRVLNDGWHGVGLDPFEALVRRAGDLGVCDARLRLGVAEAAWLPIAPSSFDRVFCYSIMQCFPDRKYACRALAEMVRVCTPGGVILVGDVFGRMEKQRKWLLHHGIGEPVADTLLWPLVPVWHIKQAMHLSGKEPRRRTYGREFFRRALAGHASTLEFLQQDIPARRVSRSRYDVRIRKSGTV